MPRQYTTRPMSANGSGAAFFLLLALAAFLLWQELSPWEKAPAPNPPAAGLTLRVIDVGQAQSLLLTCGEDAHSGRCRRVCRGRQGAGRPFPCRGEVADRCHTDPPPRRPLRRYAHHVGENPSGRLLYRRPSRKTSSLPPSPTKSC